MNDWFAEIQNMFRNRSPNKSPVGLCEVMGFCLWCYRHDAVGFNGNISLRQENFLTLAQLFGLEVFSAGP